MPSRLKGTPALPRRGRRHERAPAGPARLPLSRAAQPAVPEAEPRPPSSTQVEAVQHEEDGAAAIPAEGRQGTCSSKVVEPPAPPVQESSLGTLPQQESGLSTQAGSSGSLPPRERSLPGGPPREPSPAEFPLAPPQPIPSCAPAALFPPELQPAASAMAPPLQLPPPLMVFNSAPAHPHPGQPLSFGPPSSLPPPPLVPLMVFGANCMAARMREWAAEITAFNTVQAQVGGRDGGGGRTPACALLLARKPGAKHLVQPVWRYG